MLVSNDMTTTRVPYVDSWGERSTFIREKALYIVRHYVSHNLWTALTLAAKLWEGDIK